MTEGEQETAYKYAIPLEVEDGVEKPVYDASSEGETYLKSYEPNNLILVAEEAIPHLHKDEVNVGVEEVSAEEYTG